jgi:hypothetical protein
MAPGGNSGITNSTDAFSPFKNKASNCQTTNGALHSIQTGFAIDAISADKRV